MILEELIVKSLILFIYLFFEMMIVMLFVSTECPPYVFVTFMKAF